MHLLDVVAHFEDLFVAILVLLVVSDQSHLVGHGSEIVLDSFTRVCTRRVKWNDDGLAEAGSGLDGGLHVPQPLQPFSIAGHELLQIIGLSKDFNLLDPLVCIEMFIVIIAEARQ